MNTGAGNQHNRVDQHNGDVWPPQPDESRPKPVVVTYDLFKKLLAVVAGLALLPFLLEFVIGDDFVLHLLAVGGLVTALVFLVEFVATESITLAPDRIVKRRLLLGKTIIPAMRAVMTMDQHTIRFYEGSRENLRERITIRRFMISADDADRVKAFADKWYRIKLREEHVGSDEGPSYSGIGAGKGRQVSPLLLAQFKEAVGAYKSSLAFFAAYAILVFLIVGLSDSDPGLALQLPAFPFRLAAILLTVGGYLLLKRLNPDDPAAYAASSPASADKLTWNQRFELVDKRSFNSTLIANGVALLGLALFLLFGNLLDFYIFLAVAAYYYLDFFPRLSTWERINDGSRIPAEDAGEGLLSGPPPPRRRSLHVSLVLMGALAVTSYGESPQYLYKNKKDCMDDWGSEQSCQEPAQGTSHYRTGYYYGPRYGSGGGRGVRSVGAVSVSRGGFGSLGGIHASFGG